MSFERARRVGLISVGVPYFGVTTARAHLDTTRRTLAGRYDLCGPSAVVTEQPAFDLALAELRAAQPDVLLLQIGTFPDGETPARLAETLRVPVIVHSLPEPALERQVELNSLCGANLATFTLAALDCPYSWVHGDPAESPVSTRLGAHLDAALALADLRGLRMGLIGYRAPGFYPCVFDELLLRRKLGIAIQHVGLNEMTRELASAPSRRAPVSDFPTIEGGSQPPAAIAEMERYYGALSRLLETSGHHVFAIKDWPELFDVDAPGGFWPALGWIADDGYLLAPEGDVNGAVTMALLHSLAGKQPFFADISAWDDADSTLTVWHYGGPPSLARSKDEIRYGQEGREVQFTLRPGPAVIARVGLHRGELRLLAIAAEVTEQAVALRRAGGRVRTTATPAGQVVRAMLEGGWEHHVSLVHGDIMEQLTVAARLAGIPLLAL